MKLAIDLDTESDIDLFDLELASGSDLMFVAVSIWFMDLVVTPMVVPYTVLSGSLESLALEGLSWALSWIFLQRCLAR